MVVVKGALSICAGKGLLQNIHRADSPGRIIHNRFAQANPHPRCIICIEGSRWHSFHQRGKLVEKKLLPGDLIEHCQDDIDRATVTRELSLHDKHISRLFAHHGTTFTAFLN